MDQYFIKGCLFWGIILVCVYFLRTKSKLHSVTMDAIKQTHRRILWSVMILVILLCTVPMGFSPIWNGEIPDHRNQYEVMAEAILDGHLYLDYGDMDPRLLEMENPYDYAARTQLGISYHWDHAFYNGHYYMYFGIVPVFLLFLPFRILTGANLTTYHATQIFVALFIVGVFALFALLAKKFFAKMTFGMYLLLSSAFAMMSVWYSVGAPALYCTAIVSALCLEIWSLYFFVKAVWIEADDQKSIWLAFVGSAFGALAFGCRPPVALANLLVLPMLAVYLQKRKINAALVRSLALAALPYVVVAVLLMAYNYVRFENPFEFGQAYQLTNSNQSNYGDFATQFNLVKIINGILNNFISYSQVSEKFPYISYNAALVNFPILIFPLIGLAQETIRNELRKTKVWHFVMVLFFMPLIITIMDVLWVPYLQERYRMDIYWLMGLASFLIIGFYYMGLSKVGQKKFSHWISLWAFVTIFKCFMLSIIPYDANVTSYRPETLEAVRKVLMFGRP